jgi:hypothetical protein
MLAGDLMRVVLVPAAHGQPLQQLRVGKLQVGHVPVQQLPLLWLPCSTDRSQLVMQFPVTIVSRSHCCMVQDFCGVMTTSNAHACAV